MVSHLPHTPPRLHSPSQVFLTPKYLGVVMEYGGMDLGAYLNQEGGTMGGTEKRLSEDVSRLCFQQLILALEFCHRCGKGHRDIKLGNVSAGGWGGEERQKQHTSKGHLDPAPSRTSGSGVHICVCVDPA